MGTEGKGRQENEVGGARRKERGMKKFWVSERFRRCLSTEIGIEYKACLYFFVLLFFYSVYRVITGVYEASLLHMLEMICAAYGMGYLQVLALGNFDEAESLSPGWLIKDLLCSGLYTGIGILCGWFGGSIPAAAVFAVFCVFMFLCAYLANKLKRDIDTEQLNVMLQAYKYGNSKEGETENEKCH